MKFGLKALAAVSAALVVSIAMDECTNDTVDADTLDAGVNSADTCILKNVGKHDDVYVSSPIAVDSIRTCFLLGAANEMKTITAMNEGQITGLFRYKSAGKYYDDTPAQCEQTQATIEPHGKPATTHTGMTCE